MFELIAAAIVFGFILLGPLGSIIGLLAVIAYRLAPKSTPPTPPTPPKTRTEQYTRSKWG